MKKQILGLCLIASFSIMAKGKDGGNGGGAIVCVNNNEITSAKLLDLREAELNGLTIKRSNQPYEVQLAAALDKYAKVYPQYLKWMKTEIDLINSKDVIKKSTKRLPPPTDTGIDRLNEERSCSLEGVARYNDDNTTLEIDQVIFDKFSPTDKAALYFHEALYRVHRLKIGTAINSEVIRTITGKIFAKEKLNLIAPEKSLAQAISRCSSKDQSNANEFFIVPSDNGTDYEAHFTKIMGTKLKEKVVFNIGKSYETGDGAYPQYYQKGLRIIREQSEANGLQSSISKNYKRKELKDDLKSKNLNIVIYGSRYVTQARYVQGQTQSLNGLPLSVNIIVEDDLIDNDGLRIHYNKNVVLTFALGQKAKLEEAISCELI